jgi:superfamily II DNA or RNA helicase
LFEAGEYDQVAKAATGKGKTVMSLEIGRRLGRAMLVLVDQEFLRDQWVDRAKQFLGLRDDQIGIAQGGKCEYEGKVLVVGMVQTLYSRTYENGFYDHFGTVIFDECHTVGAAQFSRVLMQFPATYRLGVSATPDRGDALQKVIEFNLGPVQVTLEEKHRASIVRYVEYEGVLTWYANISPKSGRYLSELASDSLRTLLLAKIIKSLRGTGRSVLAVSDRIEHLEHIRMLCLNLGMPAEDLGLVTGYRNVWCYAKDPTPARRPYGWEKDTEYTPVSLQLVAKRVPKPELTRIKDTCGVLLATYGMFSKGVDVPRLGAGVDCTPRAKAEQVHGRILRSMGGKLVPVWVTIRDVFSYKAEYQFSHRIKEYQVSNAEIQQWHLSKGIKKVADVGILLRETSQNVEGLKRSRIVTGLDGNSTVLTLTTGRTQSAEAVKPTAMRTRATLRSSRRPT